MLVCWCGCVHVCTRAHGGQRCQIPLAVVSCLVWVLGLELQPSGRGAAQAFYPPNQLSCPHSYFF